MKEQLLEILGVSVEADSAPREHYILGLPHLSVALIRLQELVQQSGLRPVKVVIPQSMAAKLFATASAEADAYLRDRLLKLLVNAMNDALDCHVHKAFVSAMLDMASLELKIMDTLYPNMPYGELSHEVWTRYLPEEAQLHQPPSDDLRPPPDVELAISNLLRIGCLTTAMAFSGSDSALCVNPTFFGYRLAQAYRLKNDLT